MAGFRKGETLIDTLLLNIEGERESVGRELNWPSGEWLLVGAAADITDSRTEPVTRGRLDMASPETDALFDN